MTDLILGILLLASGLGLLIWTYKDKSTPIKHTYNYTNHLKGYIGGLSLVLLGLIKLCGRY